MATTAWGSGLSADEVLTFADNSELTGTRLAGGNVALDWVRFTGAPLHYWKFDEGTGLIAADNGFYNTPATLTNASWDTTNPWIGPAAWKPKMYEYATAHPHWSESVSALTIECWAKPYIDNHERLLFCGYESPSMRPLTPMIKVNYGNHPGALFFQSPGLTIKALSAQITAGWHHFAFIEQPTNIRIYVDGIQIAQASGSTEIDCLWDVIFARSPTVAMLSWLNDIDDFAIYGTEKYTANFSPHRYDQGSLVLTKTAAGATRRVTAVDWAGTFGSGYGAVYRVQINTGTDVTPVWETVGGDNPANPVTDLNLNVREGTTRWVRVYLTPKADALQSETPILTALRVTHESTGGAAGVIIPTMITAGRYI